ncbi:histamine N-methyltransferase-like [Amphiura filiformis]|uniref:histamine N-methyltransferase-like n=1 Tax=Amphiura filiformis TaxID=82378 RepID=UPI003B2263B6
MATGNNNMLSVQSIVDDDTHFMKSYDAFNSRLCAGAANWPTEDTIAEIMPHVMQSVNASTGKTLKALGIGSGSGREEDFFVSHFQPHFVGVHQCIVEPNKDLINQHKTNVLQNGLKGVTYEWHEERLEEFIASAKEDEKYHFITAIHSLYCVTNPEEVLGFLYDKLEENGILLTVLTSEGSVFARVAPTIPNQYTKVISPSSRSLLDYFRARGISCEVHNYPLPYDVSGCLNSDPSENESLLLDFLTHVKDFIKAPLKSEIKEQVVTTIREMLANSPIDQEGNGIVIVQKKDHKN